MIVLRVLIAPALAVLSGAAGAPAPQEASPSGPVGSVRFILEARVGAGPSGGPVYCRNDRLCGSDVLPGFYRARGFQPVWIDDALALSDAGAFVAALRRVDEDALNPDNYHLPAIEALLDRVRKERNGGRRTASPEALGDLEMLLTDAFFLCGWHLAHGQVDPETVQSEWFLDKGAADLGAVLERGLAEGNIGGALGSLRPRHPVYEGLKKAHLDLDAVIAGGGWPGFPPGPKLVKGDRGERVEALRRALEARGDRPPSGEGDPDLFDRGLETAVMSFQRRHGLEPDGVVGKATSAALNVSADERLVQVRANLERWRWVPRELGARHIIINVADFRVALTEGEREVLTMPAIVGKAYRRTPEFSGTMTYLELNPSWTVPPKLAREDILPKVRKDPAYLSDKGFRVFRDWSAGAPEIDPAGIDWAQVDGAAIAYKFRQDPGPSNALGRMKFMFPNKFDVYLHDTPEPWLFDRAVRSFSSGCIRIARPVDLAEELLRDDPEWTRERIIAAIEDGTTRVVRLRTPIGVHLLYWTAWRAADGRMQFRGDIYGRDAALYAALGQRAAEGSAPGSPGPDAADVDVDEI